jgi:predicted RNase H-like nuclease (RuvC/YqgF family)
MDFDFNSNIAIVAYVVTAFVGFFVGQSGILTKAFNIQFLRIENKLKKESDMIDKALAENETLRADVKKLNEEIIDLKNQNQELDRKMRLIIEYLKSIKVNDPFIEKIIL